jgi:2'-5' RNA ligase
MAETIRAFIAIELNDQVKQAIREFQDQLKPLGCDISWVKPENAHLTLKFLGDVKAKMVPSVTETLTNLCRDLRPFDTALAQPGVFPDLRHPRVVWIGLDDTDGNLARVAGSLETALGNIGFKKERRDFQAHITVGRIKSDKNIQKLSKSLENYNLPKVVTQSIQNISLYKSVLTGSGPVYSILARFSLGDWNRESSLEK